MAKINLIERIQEATSRNAARDFHVLPESRMSYERLNEESAAIAEMLLQKLPRQTSVMIYGHKSHAMLSCMVGCLRAGMAYVPADEILPLHRIQAMAASAKCGLILNTNEKKSLDSISGVEVLDFEAVSSLLKVKSKVGWQNAVKGPENVYILFTSGSTGVPKGVQISRNNLEDFLEWTIPSFGYDSAPTAFLNQAPFHFDLSVYELYNALATGGSLWSVRQESAVDRKSLFEVICTYGKDLQVWVSTPSFLGYSLSIPECRQAVLPHLKHFVLIGEVLPVSVAKDTLERFPNSKLLNFYGPTEATVAHTVFEVTSESLSRYPSIPIGKVKPNSFLSFDQGEMILSGPNVSKGYVNEPELTAAKFNSGKDGWSYRTGDLGRLGEDGLLFYAGRADNQIKLNGFRVELEDIERQLLRVPGISAGSVIAHWEGGKVDYLAAFVVASSFDGSLSELNFRKQVRSALSEFVPPYMVPKVVKRVEKLPLTPNGKVDRNALKELL